jgi:hypothetical protein
MPIHKLQCKYCKRFYSSKQSLCNHTSIKHKDVNASERHPKSGESNPVSVTSDEPNTTSNNTTENKYKCIYCPKTYKYRQGKSRHQNMCPNKSIMTDMQNKINQLEQKIAKINNTKGQINNGTINNTTNTNNGPVNNGTINNNYIIKFGSEDLSTILSKEDMIKICNKKFSSIEESIKMTHFNKDKPELNNVIIKNLRDDYAYVHDGDEYIVQDKNDIIADLIELHLDNIEMIINEENENNIRNKLDKKVIERLESLRDRLDDESEIKINEKRYENYKSYKINQIKLLIYNCINKLKIIMNK